MGMDKDHGKKLKKETEMKIHPMFRHCCLVPTLCVGMHFGRSASVNIRP